MSPERKVVPWRDDARMRYFIKEGAGIRTISYAQAVIIAADPHDKRKVFCAFYSEETRSVEVEPAGKRFTTLAKRAVRSAQMRNEAPPCQGRTSFNEPCKALSVAVWRDLDVCAMHDPEGEFCKANPDFRKAVLVRLRNIKKSDVARLEDRLTALLLERFGPSKGVGVIGK